MPTIPIEYVIYKCIGTYIHTCTLYMCTWLSALSRVWSVVFESHLRQLIFLRNALGVLCCFALLFV